jgi:uncharacterized protein Yka (UPF0111/DUF47 family)
MSQAEELMLARRQNVILQDCVRNLAMLINEIFEVMPENIQQLPQAVRARTTMNKIVATLDGFEECVHDGSNNNGNGGHGVA